MDNISNLTVNLYKGQLIDGKYENDLKLLSQKPKNIMNDDISAKKEKLKETAKQFEGIFVNMMLDQMRKTIDKSDLIEEGNAREVFEEMFDDEISKEISKNGNLGIANALYNQMEKYLGSDKNDKPDGRI